MTDWLYDSSKQCDAPQYNVKHSEGAGDDSVVTQPLLCATLAAAEMGSTGVNLLGKLASLLARLPHCIGHLALPGLMTSRISSDALTTVTSLSFHWPSMHCPIAVPCTC